VPERIETSIPGLVALEPAVHGDERGFLLETYSEPAWRELGIEGPFLQENHSRSTRRGTLRGLHFQTSPGQGKLVRCLRGAIFDVAVDLRRGSQTHGRWEGHLLDDSTHRQLWVPIGFAHGFQVVSYVADVAYKLTSLYDPATESQIAWNDPDIGIEWPLPEPLLSERDRRAPRLSEVAAELPF
jgi:dTDP-4-dehydrorhamnose 3,5-epimerase